MAHSCHVAWKDEDCLPSCPPVVGHDLDRCRVYDESRPASKPALPLDPDVSRPLRQNPCSGRLDHKLPSQRLGLIELGRTRHNGRSNPKEIECEGRRVGTQGVHSLRGPPRSADGKREIGAEWATSVQDTPMARTEAIRSSPLERGRCAESDASGFSLREGSTSQSRDVIMSQPWCDARDLERAGPRIQEASLCRPWESCCPDRSYLMVDRSLAPEAR
jgi:hypothetical protein